MRDYLTMKKGSVIKIADVYSKFKEYTHAGNYSKDQLVEDVYKFAKYFINIDGDSESDLELREGFAGIKGLGINIVYPFLLKIYEDYANGFLAREEFQSILELIESYIFRRSVCGIPTNGLNKTFASLYKKIRVGNYYSSFQAAMFSLSGSTRFPDNIEFKREFLVKDMYNDRYHKYMLSKLENYDRKEIVTVDEYTIEHIMPQNENLSEEWKKELGDNWKNIHNQYLHTIGNLTLTGYNSELSDRSFSYKRMIEGGFADSPLRLNRDLAKLEQWNESAIISRAKKLINKACHIWPELDTSGIVFEKNDLSLFISGNENSEEEEDDTFEETNDEIFEAVDRYIFAFETVLKEGIRPKQKDILIAHYNSQNHTSTAQRLATSVGYLTFGGVNFQYGILARRIAELIGFEYPPMGFWLHVLADWADEPEAETGHTAFVLRPAVVKALESVGLV